MLTVEELLADRFKVIAPYPGIKDDGWKVGDILDRNWCKYENDDEDAGVIEWQISDFPLNFQPLPWWSDRRVEDMPEYVRCIKSPDGIIQEGQILKCTWNSNGGRTEDMGWVFPYTNCYVPATREEYEAFKQQKEG